ncbi:MAG TPA: PEGA domain-containing protein, partial [Thermotogota bacterium]|nr:PEGA domain-containing protein [Thermotogota bacterium]
AENTSFFDGQTYTLFRQLPGSTTLFVHSFPSGMPLWLNGIPSGLTPQTLYVESGAYTIECEGPDGIRRKQIITLSGEVERTINFVF